MQHLLTLSPQQADQIAILMGLTTGVRVAEITQHNHVWQLSDGRDVFYLKAYTKVWYGYDKAATEFCVRHERDAYACLAVHGLTVPEIVLARLDCDNPLGRPFMVTRKLKGDSLMVHLRTADASEFRALLEKTGDYMRRMHAIPFVYAGYIVGDGPTAPPDETQWQHPSWSAAVTQREALARLDADRPHLSAELSNQLEDLFSNMQHTLNPAFEPPHFTQVNCHSHQYFLVRGANHWQVSGCLDMEVASAGCTLYDLVGFCIEMAAFHPHTNAWWQPFFAGYGEPNFDLFRLLLLSLPELCFRIYGETQWPGTREHLLTQLLAADSWDALFAAS